MSNYREFVSIMPKIHVIDCVSWELVPKSQEHPFGRFCRWNFPLYVLFQVLFHFLELIFAYLPLRITLFENTRRVVFLFLGFVVAEPVAAAVSGSAADKSDGRPDDESPKNEHEKETEYPETGHKAKTSHMSEIISHHKNLL